MTTQCERTKRHSSSQDPPKSTSQIPSVAVDT
jgi:hypothetical protein